MIEIRRILCPVDFSDCSRRALDHAVAIARWYESTVTLLHVYSSLPVSRYELGGPVLPSAALSPADQDTLLATMRAWVETETGAAVPVTFELGEGAPASAIVSRAEAWHSDLIVMGTHGRSGFERFALGSVTEKVLRRAPCPVLSVPPHVADVVPAPPVLYSRIVCAVDFSDCSMRALDYAMSVAQETGAQLAVVHVMEVPPEAPPDLHETIRGGPRSLADYIAAAEEDRRARLTIAVPDTVRAACPVETVLLTGKPYREILRFAADRGSDLLVVGVHGRSAADILFFGSTAYQIVRQASCPVLTLRLR